MIQVEDIRVAFGDKTVLRGVSFDVPEGGIFALIGPGASGKSVLLKVIAGLVPPSSGSVRIEGEDVTRMDEAALAEMRRHVGMLFQNYALFDYMSVGDNIAFPLRQLFDLTEQEIAERVSERLGRMALPGFESRAVGGLSGGQKKRVGVARATISRPRVLLYDEPTAGLDPVTSQKIYDLIKEEQRSANTTNVVISSDVKGLLSIADRVGMLHRGEMIFQGSVEEARSSEIPEVRQFVYGLVDGPL
ncbi:MAG TPA: ATP-binding cassette domain-containing protein [Polyangiaceae bacterium]|nr:ATP-binding cassette domain-containing protein [Polyangiaceae bacterium]